MVSIRPFFLAHSLMGNQSETFRGLKYITAAIITGPRQANLVLIAYASSEGSGEPVHARSLTRTSAARSYKQ